MDESLWLAGSNPNLPTRCGSPTHSARSSSDSSYQRRSPTLCAHLAAAHRTYYCTE